MTEALKQWEEQLVGGKYHLQQYLGGSDHSSVFLTERGGQRAAIKLIPADDPRSADLQLAAWELAANLSHPNVLRLFEMGRCQVGNEEMLYVVMEYAAESLSQVLPDRPLAPSETRDMLGPILEVLAYLHGRNLIHGHIKPTNIMAIDDRLKISSDGIFRAGQLGEPRHEPDAYDAPEVDGAGKFPAGDIWSLGVTLVEVLTQRLPHWERTDQKEVILPETLPAPFLDIARRCLRREPALRCTVADIASHLQPPAPVALAPTKRSAKPGSASAKRRYVVPAIAAVLAVAVILAAPRLAHKRPAETEPISSVAEKTNAHAGSVVPGEVAHQVLPDVPQKALNGIRGTLKVGVRVRVDASGNVVEESFDPTGPSRYFARLALDASRRWKFTPASVDGKNAPSEWILRFEFTHTTTRVTPVRAAP
jgi:serine/threonine protein kinase